MSYTLYCIDPNNPKRVLIENSKTFESAAYAGNLRECTCPWNVFIHSKETRNWYVFDRTLPRKEKPERKFIPVDPHSLPAEIKTYSLLGV